MYEFESVLSACPQVSHNACTLLKGKKDTTMYFCIAARNISNMISKTVTEIGFNETLICIRTRGKQHNQWSQCRGNQANSVHPGAQSAENSMGTLSQTSALFCSSRYIFWNDT
jgi:hypothetical protein